jgi:hypothetical protein
MKKFGFLLILSLFCINSNVFSQKAVWDTTPEYPEDKVNNINTNRPGFSISAYNVGARYFQIEIGAQNTAYNWEQDLKNINYGVDVSLRYALDYNWEIYSNLGPNGNFEKVMDQSSNDFKILPVSFGASYRFNENEGWMPAISLTGGVLFWGENDVNYSDMEMVLATQNQIGDNWTLITNIRLSQLLNHLNANYIIGISTSLNDNISWFVENIGAKDFAVDNSDFIQTFHTGFGYLVKENLQLDIFGGVNTNFDNATSYYMSAGVSWRFGRKKYNNPRDSRIKEY